MRYPYSRWAGWILACVLPQRDLEVAIGDLEEEYVLRSRSIPLPRVSRWYWSQIVRSIPPLLWASVRRGGWFATLSVAVGACIVQATVEFASKSVISSLFAPDARVPAILTLIVGLPMLVLVSYLAARIRPGAATVLATLVMIAVVIQVALKGHSMPLWKQIAAFLVGPMAAFAGGVLFLRKQT